MALNLPNFLGAPIQRNNFEINRPVNPFSGLENIVSDVYGAYHKPMEMKNAREKEKQAIENKKLDAEAKRIANLYRDQREKAEIDYLKNHALTEAMGPALARSNIGLHEAQAAHYRNPYTSTQRELGEVFGRGTPEYNEALKREHGIYSSDNIPADAAAEGIAPEVLGRNLHDLPKVAQNKAIETMRGGLRMAESQIAVIPTLEKAKGIMQANPNLWKSFAAILENPRDNALLETIKRNVVNPKDKTNVDLFGKYVADIVVKSGESWGNGRNFTDARQQLFQQRKPQIGNTAEANIIVLNDLLNEAKGGKEAAKAYRYGLKKGKDIIPDTELFRKLANTPQGTPQTDNITYSGDLSTGAQDMVQITNDKTGETRIVTREEAERLGSRK